MKFILNEKEINLAIKLYLRANAAVDVHDMEFTAKRDGLIVEVDATVLDLVQPHVEPVQVDLKEPEQTTQHEPDQVEVQFEADYNLLVNEYYPVTQEEKDMLNTETEVVVDTHEVSDDVISELEAISEELPLLEEYVEEEEESSEAEEMPVQNTLSIADILGR
jgi:glycine cleavage system regulatory protein